MNEKPKTKQQNPTFWFGLFLGGLIGSFILHLLGTKEGKKLTREFEDESEGAIAKIEKKLKELEHEGEGLFDTALKEKDSLIKTATKKADNALSHIEKLQERGRVTTANIRKRLFKNIGKK